MKKKNLFLPIYLLSACIWCLYSLEGVEGCHVLTLKVGRDATY